MNNRILKGVTAGLLSAAMLSACGGGSGSTTPPVSSGGTQSKTTTVSLKLGVPGKRTGTSVARGKKRAQQANSVSPSTVALGVSVVAHGSAFPALRTPQFAANIAAGTNTNNVQCSAAIPDGSYDCTLLFAAPVGYDDFQISGWDAAVDAVPGAGFGGTFSSTSTNLVAYGVTGNALVQLNQQNSVTVPMSGIVYSAAVLVTPGSLVAGAPSGTGSTNPTNPKVTVIATDIDGNTISGSHQYYDSTGTATTLRVSEAPSGLTGFSQVGTTYFGNVSCSGGSNCTTADFNTPIDSATITYDGAPISSTALTLAAVTGSPAGTFANGVITFTKTTGGVPVPGTPSISEITAAGFANQTRVNQVTTGPDGNLWYTEPDTNQVVRMTPAGTVVQTYGTDNGPDAIVAGADGDVWFSTTDGHAGKIDPVTNAVTQFGGFTAPVARLVSGADGNIYGVEYAGDKLVQIVPRTDAIGEYNMTSPAGPTDLTVGSDGNIWFVENTSNQIGKFNVSSSTLSETAVSGQSGPGFNSIATGADGNLWVLESKFGGSSSTPPSTLFSVSTASPSATLSTCSIGSTKFYQYLLAGPESNFYMTQGGLGSGVARVSTGCNVLEFSNGITTASSTWLAVGPSPAAPYMQNAAVWFAEATPAKVGVIQP